MQSRSKFDNDKNFFFIIHEENTCKSRFFVTLYYNGSPYIYIRIWSFWLIFAVSQWMKKNSKISQFSKFLLCSTDAIHVKICKWLKLLKSVPFIEKTLVNQFYIRIWSFWLTFKFLHWMKKSSKISQFSSFRIRWGYAI